MIDVLDRIAELRARFEPANAPSRASGASDFSALLASAKSTAGTSAATSTSRATLPGTNGADTSALAGLSRLMLSQGSTSPAARSRATSAAATTPGGYADYAATIGEIATEEGVPASLLGALVWSESSFNPDAVSSAGARGLAQLMPSTAAGLGVDIDDPVDNLRGGARFLRQMLDRFGSTELALAAYNAGPSAVERAGGVPAYKETQDYVARVTTRATTLAGAYA